MNEMFWLEKRQKNTPALMEYLLKERERSDALYLTVIITVGRQVLSLRVCVCITPTARSLCNWSQPHLLKWMSGGGAAEERGEPDPLGY